MGESADVVVVGGGVMGSAVAVHLAALGIDVRLVERDGLSQGTSAAGAGFVAPWAAMTGTGSEELEIERYATDYYAELAADGYDIDFAANGMLWVAPDDATWQYFSGSETNDDRRPVEPAEVERLTGGAVRADGVVGAIHCPNGIQVAAGKAGPAMLTRAGLDEKFVHTRRPVTGLKVVGSRVLGVETATGTISCGAVVLAAGAWSNAVLRPLGAYLPAVPLMTSRVTTEPVGVPATMPMLFLLGLAESPMASFLWVRGQDGKLIWGGHYDVPPREAFVGKPVPERFDQVSIDGVRDCERRAETAARFMPALGSYRSMTLAHGAPCFTADGRALVGPVPGFEGLYAVGGDNEAGVTHAPGFGRVLADHLVAGHSELAGLEPWRIDRFGDELSTDEAVAAAIAGRTGAGE
jgi:glycine/D-amino acid oxidase-like deaminating enzyme